MTDDNYDITSIYTNVTEEEFIEIFITLLNTDDEKEFKELYSAWEKRIGGRATLSANVYRNNEFLFICPPLQYRPSVVKSSEKVTNDAMTMAEYAKSNSPKLHSAQVSFSSGMFYGVELSSENQQSWKYLFKNYGHLLKKHKNLDKPSVDTEYFNDDEFGEL